MSSNEEDPQGKKRRLDRACDTCRRRKSRCDGSQIPGERCSTCIATDFDCTYLEAPKKRTQIRSAYVKSLETRLEHAELLIRHLRAEVAAVHSKCICSRQDFPTGNSSNNDDNGNPSPPESAASLHILRKALRSLSAPPQPNADDFGHLEISRKFEKMAIGKTLPEQRFIGKSSNTNLIHAALDLKADVHRSGNGKRGEYNEGEDSGSEHGEGASLWTSRRLQFWTFKPWETRASRTVAYSFPPPDLAAHLIDLYFTHMNSYIPLLHRPTFQRGVDKGLHHEDDGFAVIVLLVCAVASRWSDDPRVLMAGRDGRAGKADSLACGWQWFDQIPLRRHQFGHATLNDLQYYCLSVQFLEGSSAPHGCWALLGVGIRLAQDVGAHRRKMQHETPSVERELWKRAFWILVYMDRTTSANLGRTCAINYDDFDLDFPIECDDEYWEHPTHPFQQPPGVPSRITFFNSLLRLNNILGLSLRVLYPLNKVKIMFSISDDWEEQVVAELDSALNSWHDDVPAHLRWDPARVDPLFFDQSVMLHCAYHHLQILIHRPFIPMVRKSAPTALPSLAICLSAARACANMVDIQRRRKGGVPVPANMTAVITSGLVLLLNMWSGKRTGLVPDPSREFANVNKCMEVIRLCEARWQCAGIIWDILSELASVGQLPLRNLDSTEMVGTGQGLDQQSTMGNVKQDVTSIWPQAIMLDPPTSDGAISDAQFHAPYTNVPQGSFASGIGGASMQALEAAPMEPSAFAQYPSLNTSMSEDPFANMTTDPTQAARELDEIMSLVDSDTIAMWTNVPNGLEVDDWGNYFSTFSEIMQG
ncbi:fungal-specific transcription factor domain-containing protein [Mycena maculata]|uniref:Fungal-specific transcription factor domain-containing protein n=1 Tax=Mycena maculata TaxID=230809 RepID=A0AAD7HF30_9AGAR|nr:fungal-specific transcription factor domain-containing protein [Mycena maculata]